MKNKELTTVLFTKYPTFFQPSLPPAWSKVAFGIDFDIKHLPAVDKAINDCLQASYGAAVAQDIWTEADGSVRMSVFPTESERANRQIEGIIQHLRRETTSR